jgi:hypothetical protein
MLIVFVMSLSPVSAWRPQDLTFCNAMLCQPLKFHEGLGTTFTGKRRRQNSLVTGKNTGNFRNSDAQIRTPILQIADSAGEARHYV